MASSNLSAKVDAEGLKWLRRALNQAEELEDLAAWRPEVPRLAKCLKKAIQQLRVN